MIHRTPTSESHCVSHHLPNAVPGCIKRTIWKKKMKTIHMRLNFYSQSHSLKSKSNSWIVKELRPYLLNKRYTCTTRRRCWLRCLSMFSVVKKPNFWYDTTIMSPISWKDVVEWIYYNTKTEENHSNYRLLPSNSYFVRSEILCRSVRSNKYHFNLKLSTRLKPIRPSYSTIQQIHNKKLTYNIRSIIGSFTLFTLFNSFLQ